MTCPICSDDKFWAVPAARDPQAETLRATGGDDHGYEWRLCRRCGDAYPSSPPSLQILQRLWALNRTDADSSVREKADRWAYRRAIAQAGARHSFRLFAPLSNKPTGRFLDIACGLGETVHTFAEHGWDAEGIDADPNTEPFHHKLGIRTRIGQFEQIDVNESYDIIHIAHGIYFITDPMGFMQNVRRHLSPRGLFCVVLADFMANSDSGLPSYTHTFFPTASSMRYALALAGFTTIRCERLSGSIFIAARPADVVATPSIWPAGIWLLYRTKALRYAILGRPYLLLRRAAKFLLGRR